MFILVHPSLQLPDDSLDNHLKKNEMRSKIVNNTKNSLFFNKKTITRLSTPYQNKCIDYLKSTSSELCYIKCAKSRYKTMKKCISYENVWIFNTTDDEYKICNMNELENFYNFTENYCKNECIASCTEEVYEYELLEPQKTIKFSEEYSATIKMYFKSDNELEFVYRPRMTLIDFFGILGGLMSLWMGLSFLSLYDYLALNVEKILSLNSIGLVIGI